MDSNLRAGILSVTGLMLVNLCQGFLLISDISPTYSFLPPAILNPAFLLFLISFWITLKYVLVDLYNLIDLKRDITWLINNLGVLCGIELIYTVFRTKEIYFIDFLIRIIVIVNYIILFWKIYQLDNFNFKPVNDLQNYIVAIIFMGALLVICHLINEFFWHKNIEIIFQFLKIIPLLFLVIFFHHVNLDKKKFKIT